MAKYDRLLAVVTAELGYLEKRSNADLDSKTANAGNSNFTKYARDVDNTDLMNGKKQGYAWCAVFVCWCFMQSYGLETARKMLYLPKKSLAAGVNYLRNYFAAEGRLYATPMVGDVVFFGDQHTGIVVDADGSNLITTIEGNTSGASGVISNGGGVCRKMYDTTKTKMTFGRPAWDLVAESAPAPSSVAVKSVSVTLPQVSKGSKGSTVKALQILLNGYGFSCGTADGDFGTKTDSAVKAFQAGKKLTSDGIVGAQTWGKMLNG